MADSLPLLDVDKRKHQLEKKRRWNDEPMIKVPNLIGKTKDDLKKLHYTELNLDTEGSGDVIISQSPGAGEKLKTGSTIRIYLGNKSNGTE